MSLPNILFILLLLTGVSFFYGRRRSLAIVGGTRRAQELHSRPTYYGWLLALWCFIPAFLVFFAWSLFDDTIITSMVVNELPQSMQELPDTRLQLLINDIRNVVAGTAFGDKDPAVMAAAERYKQLQTLGNIALAVAVLGVASSGLIIGFRKIVPEYRARNDVEQVLKILLIICSTLAIFTTIGIVLSVLFEAIRFFRMVPITEFLFGLEWSPQMAIRADQVGSSGAFGAVPVFAGTMLISAIAMLVAVPIGLMSAIYLSEYADRKVRAVVKPVMEILAGVPTVVYGFFAALMVAPLFRGLGESLGMNIASESAIAAGSVMGIMIIPFVSSLSDDAINAVPQSLREGSYGLGATKSETVRKVVLPAALPGIVGGILLAVSRAIGETMIVVMAAGLAANLTANPFQAVTTVTVQIVTLLVGDQEFDSPKTLAAFALGLVLFLITLVLNVIALIVVRKYREQYE
ncbi:phosphate ABC transporter permease subunit PstC [Oceanidesulfovibrio indonesiensis]|uniref:Phosphate transport system permease protein n=1 Tax=Oceanidesulfovibrio indonesiensis TaxID=54767 RepID=A0A7M3MJQ2_9BACT|nr:phosphate ABC transporter permease subunit PstC [Oceanidesulfovibrio indonesiensis]